MPRAAAASPGPRVRLLLACLAVLAASDAAGEVTLANAWLRPARAGAAEAAVYVDIRSTEALDLVGARSPVAGGAELVRVDPPDPDPAARRVVASIPVAADRETRLAYLGSHVRLTGVTRDLVPGMRVLVEFTFADATGQRQTVAAEARVRGIVANSAGPAVETAPVARDDAPAHPGAATPR